MARNIEIKARIDSVDFWLAKAKALADSSPRLICQDDTFFSCPNGRLKLRAFSSMDGELIFYRRPDHSGPKESTYSVVAIGKPDSLRDLLSTAYGEIGRVRKTRSLFLIGRTRLHLDRVEGLGDFIELEVVLSDGEPAEDGIRVASELMSRLGIAKESLLEGAYVDLLKSTAV